jgi:hypothetical protein
MSADGEGAREYKVEISWVTGIGSEPSKANDPSKRKFLFCGKRNFSYYGDKVPKVPATID